MPHPLTRKIVVKPCMKRKSKRWWCCILHEQHFCVVFIPRSNLQHQTVKYILILQLSCISPSGVNLFLYFFSWKLDIVEWKK
jgi:hypothetical protein